MLPCNNGRHKRSIPSVRHHCPHSELGKDTTGIWTAWSHFLAILSESNPHKRMRCFWQSSWSARSISTVTEITEAFAWPVSVKTHIPYSQTSCIPCASYEAANGSRCLQTKAWHKKQQKKSHKWNKHVHECRRMQRSAEILLASSPISLSISKDLLMHQLYSNYPDHTALKRTYPLSQMDPWSED